MESQDHKCTAWGCRGFGRIPKAKKSAIIQAKFGQNIQLHSRVSEVVFIFPTKAK